MSRIDSFSKSVSALLVCCTIVAQTSFAFAGKFKPVEGEDWPETGETNSAPAPSDGEDGDDSGRGPQAVPAGIPKLRMLPDGSPDPDSLKDFLN